MSFEKYRNILPGQLNPELTPKIGTPIARPSNITDSAAAVHRKTMSNLVAPNVFEGVTTFRAIVLCPYIEDGGALTELTNQSPGESISFRCMIPELHLGLPNPFSARDEDEFKEISSTFYPIYGVPESRKSEFNSGAPLGSIVEVRFDDPNKSIGYVVAVSKRVDLGNYAPGQQSGRNALTNNPTLPGTPQTQTTAAAALGITNLQLQDKIDSLVPNGRITSNYGKRTAPMPGASTDHKGVDIRMTEGSDIVTPMAGEDTKITTSDSGYGNTLEITHADGTVTRYAHLSGINLLQGPPDASVVDAGDVIAFVGQTGTATGPHLHFEVEQGTEGARKQVDPLVWLVGAQADYGGYVIPGVDEDPAESTDDTVFPVEPIAPAGLPY